MSGSLRGLGSKKVGRMVVVRGDTFELVWRERWQSIRK